MLNYDNTNNNSFHFWVNSYKCVKLSIKTDIMSGFACYVL